MDSWVECSAGFKATDIVQPPVTLRALSIFGTRPEAIKMAPVIHALANDARVTSLICTTGQHRELLDGVNATFGLRPDIDLGLMQTGQGLTHITTSVLERLPTVFERLRPDVVLVHGDTTTSFAAALAAFYAGVPVAHVEAGLRTGDLTSPWPEEANRQLTSRLTRLHFAPTAGARANLLREGVADDRVLVTGNTVIDALMMARERVSDADRALLPPLAADRRLILVTGHRRENHDGGLERTCRALARLAARDDVELIYPVHPNPIVRATAAAWLSGRPNVHLIEPLEYLPFVALLERASMVVTDSGGVQEEAPSLGVPVLVTRDTTERPEAVDAGTVRLVGTSEERLVAEATRLLDDQDAHSAMARAVNPYGDGQAAARIVSRLVTEFERAAPLVTVA